MNSLRSPLQIAFTCQVSCAPVGARYLPFTCFASHTLSFLTRSYFIPPIPLKGVRFAHNILHWGSAAAKLFLRACGSLRANRAVMLFAFPLCAYSSFISVLRSSLLQFSHFRHPTQEYIFHFTSRVHSPFIPQSACNPPPLNLLLNGNSNFLKRLLQAVIASISLNYRFVSFIPYPCLSLPRSKKSRQPCRKR